MSFLIRDAAPGDINDIGALEARCFSLPWTQELLARQLIDGQHVFLCAAEGDTVLGYAGFSFVLDEGYVGNVAVFPEFRRRGVGDALVSALIVRARALGLSFLTLEVRAGNAPAVALYTKRGFIPVGRRKNYYEKPAEDAVLMTVYFRNTDDQGEPIC